MNWDHCLDAMNYASAADRRAEIARILEPLLKQADKTLQLSRDVVKPIGAQCADQNERASFGVCLSAIHIELEKVVSNITRIIKCEMPPVHVVRMGVEATPGKIVDPYDLGVNVAPGLMLYDPLRKTPREIYQFHSPIPRDNVTSSKDEQLYQEQRKFAEARIRETGEVVLLKANNGFITIQGKDCWAYQGFDPRILDLLPHSHWEVTAALEEQPGRVYHTLRRRNRKLVSSDQVRWMFFEQLHTARSLVMISQDNFPEREILIKDTGLTAVVTLDEALSKLLQENFTITVEHSHTDGTGNVRHVVSELTRKE